MRKLVRLPTTAMAIIMIPITGKLCFHSAKIAPPTEVPRMIAIKVLISSRPLPRDNSFSGSISGKMPYLAGLKKVAWSPMRKTPASMA